MGGNYPCCSSPSIVDGVPDQHSWQSRLKSLLTQRNMAGTALTTTCTWLAQALEACAPQRKQRPCMGFQKLGHAKCHLLKYPWINEALLAEIPLVGLVAHAYCAAAFRKSTFGMHPITSIWWRMHGAMVGTSITKALTGKPCWKRSARKLNA